MVRNDAFHYAVYGLMHSFIVGNVANVKFPDAAAAYDSLLALVDLGWGSAQLEAEATTQLAQHACLVQCESHLACLAQVRRFIMAQKVKREAGYNTPVNNGRTRWAGAVFHGTQLCGHCHAEIPVSNDTFLMAIDLFVNTNLFLPLCAACFIRHARTPSIAPRERVCLGCGTQKARSALVFYTMEGTTPVKFSLCLACAAHTLVAASLQFSPGMYVK